MTQSFVTYQLTILLESDIDLTIGESGTHSFPAGYYVYTGSARRSLEARIARHLRKAKKLKWHIDFLLAAPGASIIQVERFTQPECKLNQRQTGTVLIKGFGATDCRSGCGSHLKYLGRIGSDDKQD